MRRHRRAIVAIAATLLTFVIGVGAAFAGYGQVGSFSGEGSEDGQVKNPRRAALEQSTGNLFVVDRDNDRVQVFAPDGDSMAYLAKFGAGLLDDPYGIAVSEQAGQTVVYVTSNSNGGEVVKLESDEQATPSFTVDGAYASPAQGTEADQVQSFDSPLAVAPNGDLWVADKGSNVVKRFDPTGAHVAGSNFDGSNGASAFTGLLDLATASTGDVVVIDSSANVVEDQTGTSSKVLRYSAAGAFEEEIGPTDGAGSLAIDPDDGSILIGGKFHSWNSSQLPHIYRFAADGSPLGGFDVDAMWSILSGLAADGGSERLYAMASEPAEFGFSCCGAERGFVFEPFPDPFVSADSVSDIAYTTAKAHGTIDPEDVETFYRFEYATQPDFSDAVQGEQLGPIFGSDPQSVEADIAGLAPNAHYYVRLAAINTGGTTFSSTPHLELDTLEVMPPVATANAATDVSFTSATLNGEVTLANDDPAFNASSCAFEHITDAAYDQNIAESEPPFEGAKSTPCDSLPAGQGSHEVAAELTGLKAGTEYHVRLVATNAGGDGVDEAPATFTTAPVDPPTVTIGQPTGVGGSTARLSGTVDPGDDGPAFGSAWRFQVSPDDSTWTTLTMSGRVLGDGAREVSARAFGLEPNTHYFVRLLATNAGGTSASPGPNPEFTTLSADVETTAASLSSPTGAQLNGWVNRLGATVTDCRFEYGTSTAYGKEEPCPGVDEHQQVSVDATDGTFRLVFGGDETADIPVDKASASAVQQALDGIAPAGDIRVIAGRPDYRFLFVGSLARQDIAQLAAKDGSVPLSGGSGLSATTIRDGAATGVEYLNDVSGTLNRFFSVEVAGLEHGTTYHYRLVAAVAGEPVVGEDATFSTMAPDPACANEARRVEQHATYLPDCRAFEMVSPPAKNGADVMGDSARTRAAIDGEAVAFNSLTGFGDVRGTGTAAEYVSVRSKQVDPSGNGWATHGITPRQDPKTLFGAFQGMDPLYVGEFSANLERGVYLALSPLTDAPNVKDPQNLYRRDDLLTPGAGSYRLITDSPTPQPITDFGTLLTSKPRFVAASADLEQIAFESTLNLAPGVVGNKRKLYLWDEGSVELAGVLPDGSSARCSGGTETCSIGGMGPLTYSEAQRVVSADGSRVNFLDPVSPGNSEGTLYQRVDGDHTIHVNASERTDCNIERRQQAEDANTPFECTGSAEPSSSSPARFWAASRDGSRVFFISGEALTDDALGGGLYMYDANAPAGEHLTLLSADANPVDGGGAYAVLGTSNDGSYVYFLAFGQLVSGSPELGPNNVGIYLWHEGKVDFIGEMPRGSDDDRPASLETFYALERGRYDSRVTPDGRSLLFSTTRGPRLLSVRDGEDYDHGAQTAQRYMYRADTEELECVSCDPSGAPGVADADADVRSGTGSAGPVAHVNRSLSDDGRYTFFETQAALIPAADTNGKEDVYQYDGLTNRLSLLSSGTDKFDSYFMDASGDGKDVFILTRERLVGWDIDDHYDLYDVRAGGGFPEPPATPAPCAGDSCRQPVAPPPGVAPAGSGLIVGPADRSDRCGKGKRRVKAKRGKSRCVKVKSQRKKRRKAHAGRRAAR